MYAFDSRIRYSEVGSDLKLRLLSLLDYFQDASTFHSEDLGLGVDYLKGFHEVWLMSYWQIDIERFANLCERVTIGTFPYEFKGCFGFRNFLMQDENGEMIAKANSLWTLMNMETMSPCRPTQKMMEGYVLEPRLDMEYLPRKIVLTGEPESMKKVEVTKRHLDSNMHVNNGQYVAIACDYLPEDFGVKRMRASYHKSAVLGDEIYPKVYHMEDGSIGVALCTEDGEEYVRVVFECR